MGHLDHLRADICRDNIAVPDWVHRKARNSIAGNQLYCGLKFLDRHGPHLLHGHLGPNNQWNHYGQEVNCQIVHLGLVLDRSALNLAFRLNGQHRK